MPSDANKIPRTGPDACKACQGSGVDLSITGPEAALSVDCPKCFGSGWRSPCEKCRGSGQVVLQGTTVAAACIACEGTGKGAYDWKKARTVRLLVTSPSQHETFDLCKRKWWLKHVRKLKEASSTSQVFGTVLHSVIDRWLRGDALGRDPQTGMMVDLYPPGWMRATNRFDETKADGDVTPAEGDLIKRLVSAAIEQGVLEKPLDRVIEQNFQESIIHLPCPRCEGTGETFVEEEPGNSLGATETCSVCKGDGKGTHVMIKGFIDLLDPHCVTDHKSTKSMKWAKSPAKLRNDIQMRVYAWYLLVKLYRANDMQPPEKIILRHNQFCKDENDLRVRKTEAFITPEEIDAFWGDMERRAVEMDGLRRRADKWSDCPDPPEFADACNAYGGCNFRSICGGRETEEIYEKRLARWEEMQYVHGGNTSNLAAAMSATAQLPEEKGNAMSLADKLNGRNAVNAAVTGTTQIPPVTVNPPVQVAAQPVMQQAPMAVAAVAQPVQQQAPVAQPVVQQQAPVAQVAAAVQGAVAGAGPQFKHSVIPNAVPWAVDGCGGCKGLGFNSRGAACRICEANGPKCTPPLPSATTFNLTPQGDGTVVWVSKTDPDDNGVSPFTGTAGQPVVTEAKTQPAAPVQQAPVAVQQAPVAQAPVAQVAAAPVAQPVQTAPLAQVEVPTGDVKGQGRAGRPKKGFILVINAVVAKGEERLNSGRGVVRLNEVLVKFGALLAERCVAAGILKPNQTYFDLPAFDRRDELAKAAEQICENFGSDLVVADLANGTPDLKALCEAIRPFAGMEIVAQM